MVFCSLHISLVFYVKVLCLHLMCNLMLFFCLGFMKLKALHCGMSKHMLWNLSSSKSSLGGYKVLGVLGKVMLVLDSPTNLTYVIKVGLDMTSTHIHCLNVRAVVLMG